MWGRIEDREGRVEELTGAAAMAAVVTNSAVAVVLWRLGRKGRNGGAGGLDGTFNPAGEKGGGGGT
jgi:hypothetical protein